MAEGKQRDEWSRWSYWIASYMNTQIDHAKTTAFQPRDFNPFLQSEVKRERDPKSDALLAQAKAATYQPAAIPHKPETK